MSKFDIKANLSTDERSTFMRDLLNDVRAFEEMASSGLFETGVHRIGAEQEMVLVDNDWQPAPVAMEILADIDDHRVTTEIARFNLEANLEPLEFTGKCLSAMEQELRDVIRVVHDAAASHQARVLLAGILPTLTHAHLGIENISDQPRYAALNDAITSLRGKPYELQIQGIDELSIEHDSIMLESLNTSFQLHYQVDIQDFASSYNLAQAMAAPLLASCANSPVLFGKRLWRETRIAIFQQAVDTRHASPQERNLPGRVHFGDSWVEKGPLELFKNDITNFRVLLGRPGIEDPFAAMADGRTPRLEALQLHNSTVYRWNRPCYGIIDGRPHIRIENRVLPSGPSVIDEMANAALWFGIMRAGVDEYGDFSQLMDFDDVLSNFLSSSRQGMNAELTWINGTYVPARSLLLEELIPLAQKGLESAGIDPSDSTRYLEIIRKRVDKRRTGAQWILSSATSMKKHGTRSERLVALTAAMARRQDISGEHEQRPVHAWSLARIDEGTGWSRNYLRVEQYMQTDIRTVHPGDTVELVASLMDWSRSRHIPVEDGQNRLVGLVGYRSLLAYLVKCLSAGTSDSTPDTHAITEIMNSDPIVVGPQTSTVEAMSIMRQHDISCLPVVKDGRLVGMISEHDYLGIAGQLLEEQLRNSEEDGPRTE